MPDTAQNGTTSSDALQGWKDIANYLGRSVRAVQRWERELGLPVRRIKTTDGQTVYAQRCEIDEWKKSRDLPKPQPEDDEVPVATAPVVAATVHSASATDPIVEPAPRPDPLARYKRRPTWPAFVGVAVICLALGAAIAPYLPSRAKGPVTAIQAAGTSVTAFNSAGGIVWRTEMGEQVTEVGDRRGLTSPAYAASGVAIGPQSDIIVVLRFGDPLASTQSDAVVSFNSEGHLKWKVQPNPTMVCGDQTFVGPWELTGHVVVSQDKTRPRMWAAFNHNTHWPSMLIEIVEVDGKAHDTVRYMQNGWIRGFAEWLSPKEHLIAVNGTLNEFSRASTALLDPNAPPATSPHGNGGFSCDGTPTGMPVSVHLWPNLDVQGPEANPMATNVKPLSNGVQLLLEQGGGGTLVEIDDARRVRSLTLPDTYWLVHRRRQAEGWIKHPAESCPEPTRDLPIETWTAATGWTHSTIRSTNGARTTARAQARLH
ncbi:MAG: hypothetical protein KAY59_05930 [Acidobacteria bacterium]|nr:hypothetical protein [Acidobacteriota bacterium]